MSEGDETTQIPKHSQTGGGSALHQSRGHKVH